MAAYPDLGCIAVGYQAPVLEKELVNILKVVAWAKVGGLVVGVICVVIDVFHVND